MAETTVNLGFLPKNRGEYQSNTRYYKDNIVQYNGSSYISDPVGYSDSNPTDTYTTIAPTDSSGNLNSGWRVFASGNNTFTTGESVTEVGIDHTPTAGSDNLVKSGGVAAQTAFLTCITNANTAAKDVSVANFVLTNGIFLKIKFTKVNTADNVTLNINSTGAHPLYLDGVAVMSNVSWNANDVLFVWFDGTNYQALSSLVTKDLLNINAYNRKSSNYTSHLLAYQGVPEVKRKMGLIVTYLFGNKWHLAQFKGVNISSQYWENVTYWEILFPLEIDETPTESSNKLVKSGGVWDAIKKANDRNSISVIGSKIIPDTWNVGSYNANGTINTSDTDANYSKIDISVFQNSFITIRTYCTINRHCCFFDSSNNLVSRITPSVSPASVEECYFRTVKVPSNAKYLGITNVQGGYVANANVFVIKSDTSSYVYDTLLKKDILYSDYLLKSQQSNLLPIIYYGNNLVSWHYINSSGVPTAISNADFCYTFVKIPKNAASFVCELSQSGWNVGAIYDSNMDFIATMGNTDSSGKKTFDLTQYPTAQYVGINFKLSWSNESASFDNVYRYIYFGMADNIDVTDSLGTSSQIAASQKLVTDLYKNARTYGHCINKPIDLNNKKVTFSGDSITKGVSSAPVWGVITDCWAKLFCDHFGATIENLAVSGDLIFDPRSGKSSVCKVVTQYTGTTDVIIVAGGTNDFTYQSYFSNQDKFGTFGDNTEISFYGALDVICNKFQTDYPNVPVIFITPINRSKGVDSEVTEIHTLTNYRNAIWEVATKYGYNVVDGSMLAGFPNFREEVSNIKTLLLADNLHPTDTGHRYYAECMAGIIG